MIKGFGAAIALALAIVAGPASAQSNHPVRSGTFYEDRAGRSTTNNSLITTFAQTPSDKFLNITRVSCEVAMQMSFTLLRVYLGIGTTSGSIDTGRIQYLDIGSVGSGVIASGTTRIYNFNLSAYLKVGPGRYPSISVDIAGSGPSNTALATSCSIIGDLSDN